MPLYYNYGAEKKASTFFFGIFRVGQHISVSSGRMYIECVWEEKINLEFLKFKLDYKFFQPVPYRSVLQEKFEPGQ